ncbi:hypothetical protein FS749_006727 [Ceratobasidium sp. UAMH 11750]|nr:hypothetical protein FS749_006727 [Ceratobasidium sp. UAMH 11750]
MSFTVVDSSLSGGSHGVASHPSNTTAQANTNVDQDELPTPQPPALAENDPLLGNESDGIAQALENDSTHPEVTSRKFTRIQTIIYAYG